MQKMAEDIITAQATAWGEGGIAIVRLSGEGCARLAGKIFSGRRPFEEQPPRYMALGTLRTRGGEAFDEALAVRFPRGASYTGEESAEIHCHGGLLSAQKCVEELCALGARLAEPGEFTRRAFVNGRVDLAQAEAVLGIIKARSDEALKASARALQGGLTAEIKKFMDELTELAAALEVDLDFPEEGEGFIAPDESAARIKALAARGAELLSKCRAGMLLREGARVAIIGRPNVGKSSLLNALLEENRAIVTAAPGTTRDSIEETFIYKGLPIRIIDTAGIRETSDEAEAIGVGRSLRAMKEADVVLWVIDGSAPDLSCGPNGGSAAPDGTIIVVNKSDLPQKITEETLNAEYPGAETVSISAARGDGIEELKEIIFRRVSGGGALAGGYAVTARQMECLTEAGKAIDEAAASIEAGAGNDATIACVAEARAALSSLLGLDASENLLDKVFGNFCVGK